MTTVPIEASGPQYSRKDSFRLRRLSPDRCHAIQMPSSFWKHVADPMTKFSVSMKGFFGATPREMIVNELDDVLIANPFL
jgi:hypothetical protein